MHGLAEDAAGLLELYRSRINTHDFDEVAPLIAEDAVFWFNDGSFAGISAIRSAFERTWQRYPSERYWLEDVVWIAGSDGAAACIYNFRWTASIDGRAGSGGGRGTSIMRRYGNSWRIAHEHLSAFPPPTGSTP